MVPFDLRVKPWWSLTVSSPPRTLQRSPKVTRPLCLFKLKTLQYGCLWIPFDLRVDAWCKLKVSEPLKVQRALCLFRLKPWKNGENWLSWPSKASGKNLKRSRRCSIGLFNVNFWPHTQEKSSLATIFESPLENGHTIVEFVALHSEESLFPNICGLPLLLFIWLKWARYLAVAGLNLLAQISDTRSPSGV